MAIVQGIDLDFVRYVARRRGDAAERAWGSTGYTYAGDAKLRRTLGRVTPCTLAVDRIASVTSVGVVFMPDSLIVEGRRL